MEYIRRKKLYSAANEFYTGRKLFDIALDYGYETPAGFYKAFQSVFGCSPQEYKNKLRSDIKMNIENVKTIEELEECYKLLYTGHPIEQFDPESDGRYSRKWLLKEYEKNPELFLFAKDDNKICSVVWGFGDGEGIVIHEGINNEYWNTGIFEALFVELENRAKKFGFKGLCLGIGEGQEEFYAKLGFTGKMLIQSEKYSVDELLKVIENDNYEVTGKGIHDGYVNQVWLNVSILDKTLKKRYEQDLGNCWTQIIVSKGL